MCGLAGCFSGRPESANALLGAVGRMIAPIEHRGPDDHGAWVDPDHGLALGFRRLAILDLSENGHQPMRSHGGRFVMVFNGEVYNFAVLRDELAGHGARFVGHSDSEVMLAAFERWGIESSLRRFVGMFALAVWDSLESRLYLARDRFGKKPLFIYSGLGTVSFGSELKALMAGPSFDRSVDAHAVGQYLRYLYVPSPRSIFRHVQKLPPGHFVCIEDPSAPLPESVPYWSLDDVVRQGAGEPFEGSDAEARTRCEALLREAVRLRMVADVPLGAFLSGGIDSSLVVAMMQEESVRPVRTFSIGFEESDYDESVHAARVAEHLGTDHTSVRLTPGDALRLVPSMPDWFDEPLADPSQLPTFLVCREARREVTVAISGDGGDELFGGYNRYLHGVRLIRAAKTLGRLGRAGVAGALRATEAPGVGQVLARLPGFSRMQDPLGKVRKLGVALRAGGPESVYRSLMSAGFQDPARLLRPAIASPDAIGRAFSSDLEIGLLSRMMFADQLEYLPDDLLAKVDRVSMAVSLEVRVPLLDHRLAEFSWSLPQALKVRGGDTKWLLRELLYARVPKQLVDRPKMGFSVPIDRWLRGPLNQWAEDHLTADMLGRSGLFHVDEVRRSWDCFKRGDPRVSGMGVWALVHFQAWYERWVTSADTRAVSLRS